MLVVLQFKVQLHFGISGDDRFKFGQSVAAGSAGGDEVAIFSFETDLDAFNGGLSVILQAIGIFIIPDEGVNGSGRPLSAVEGFFDQPRAGSFEGSGFAIIAAGVAVSFIVFIAVDVFEGEGVLVVFLTKVQLYLCVGRNDFTKGCETILVGFYTLDEVAIFPFQADFYILDPWFVFVLQAVGVQVIPDQSDGCARRPLAAIPFCNDGGIYFESRSFAIIPASITVSFIIFIAVGIFRSEGMLVVPQAKIQLNG